MNPILLFLFLFLLAAAVQTAPAIQPPAGLVMRTGDLSVVLHWDPNSDPNLSGYKVYRSTNSLGPFTLLTSSAVTSPGFCDLLNLKNDQIYYYYVTAVTSSVESSPSMTNSAAPHLFASDDQFLDYVQQTSFDYFWYGANPANGLVPDRSSGSYCSIAAVGFGLTAIGIGIDHGWISRTQGVARVVTTLNTFLQGPQGTNTTGVIGYKGWFYHFLDMNTALRTGGSELSSIDTALLLGGILYAKQYFTASTPDETNIRAMADSIFNIVDWNWMAQATDAVAMGWQPTTGFSGFGNWIGYNEGMIIYCLGLGAATNPLPASAWSRSTTGYTWSTNYGQAFVPFPPLFGHQYSHCWIDFRHVADSYMNSHNSTYFENSRRATIAQRSYCIANPTHQVGYSSNVWGLTACDGPNGYGAHGAPPPQADDGTIAPTAAGGSMAFAPEYCLPTLRHFYAFRINIWTAYGFRDAFNLGAGYYGPDELGIDQGPIVIMIENYRTQRPWSLFMRNAEVQRGLQRAGFVSLQYALVNIQSAPDQNGFVLSWDSTPGITYQVEYSPDLITWFMSPTGELTANSTTTTWIDTGPPATSIPPLSAAQRFYRVFRFGAP